MRKLSISLCLLFVSCTVFTQNKFTTCSHEHTIQRHLINNPNFLQERDGQEILIQDYIKKLRAEGGLKGIQNADFVIPVVLHVFHDGEDGRLTEEQLRSGLKVLNDDMNGRNSDWEDVDSEFDGIKATLNIEFCLASIDPNGNPTSGINYYDDKESMLNMGELRVHAWDNYKYLNIYMPKYTRGEPSLFTAFAYYPSTANSNANLDGVFYSSIRWGYGAHSELEDGQEWASVVTHELGHWLDLRHTFQSGCAFSGDMIDDTPPTLGGEIFLSDCYNNDFSCGERTNGENYMDYNHDCKKMFTIGQVERMLAALQLPSRMPLWQEANLIATGCLSDPTATKENQLTGINLYPNPAHQQMNLELKEQIFSFIIYDTNGKILDRGYNIQFGTTIKTEDYTNGIYFAKIWNQEGSSSRKMMVQHE